MKGLRRKNIYLEELFKKFEEGEIKGGDEEIAKITATLKQIVDEYNKENEDNGHIFHYPYQTLITKVNDFTEKWRYVNTLQYECDEIEIKDGKYVNIKIGTEFEKYQNPNTVTIQSK